MIVTNLGYYYLVIVISMLYLLSNEQLYIIEILYMLTMQIIFALTMNFGISKVLLQSVVT